MGKVYSVYIVAKHIKNVNNIKSKSIIETKDIDYNIEDIKLITLSTCSDRGKNRLAVHGILVQ